jgi:TonB family protein
MLQKLGPGLVGAVIGMLLFWGMTRMVAPPDGAPDRVPQASVEIPLPTRIDETPPPPQREVPEPPAADQVAGIRGQEVANQGIRGLDASEMRDEVMGTMVARPARSGDPGPGTGDEQTVADRCVDREVQQRVLIAPDYPIAARREGLEGQVEVEFTVGPDGKVSEAKVVGSSARAFEAPALSAVKRWTFEPRTVGCAAVASRVRQVLRFGLEDE